MPRRFANALNDLFIVRRAHARAAIGLVGPLLMMPVSPLLGGELGSDHARPDAEQVVQGRTQVPDDIEARPVVLDMASRLATVPHQDQAEMERFLDRLMLAESGGRDDARNPRSTAVGPYQFIESTFLEVCRRHFPAETASMGTTQILALRSNRGFSRRAAEAFTRDNAAHLAVNGLAGSASNLRLAFLLGPHGAVRVLKAEPGVPVIGVVGPQVVQANPFMAGMTARDLALWSGRNLAGQDPGRLLIATPAVAGKPASALGQGSVPALAAPAPSPRTPVVTVTCNLDLASCRKFLVLAQRRVAARATRTAVVQPPRRSGIR